MCSFSGRLHGATCPVNVRKQVFDLLVLQEEAVMVVQHIEFICCIHLCCAEKPYSQVIFHLAIVACVATGTVSHITLSLIAHMSCSSCLRVLVAGK